MPRSSRYDEDDDDRPRRRLRRRDDYDDDDRPVRRRRRARPKPQGNTGLIVLAVVGGILLLCGGAGVGGYFMFLHPKVALQQQIADDIKNEEANARVSKTKLDQLRAGMTKAQVEAVMGSGRVAEWADVVSVTGAFDDAHDKELRWQPAREQKRVYVWDEFTDRILVAYSTDPNNGGTVVGLLAVIDRTRTYTEPVFLPGAGGRR
jgi:hypothetical protein